MSINKNSSLFSDLTAATKEPRPAATTERKRNSGYLQERDHQLSQLVSGELVDKLLRWVDPARCRMWAHHNRRYDLLNETRCADLIEGFKSQGQQEFPAIVRRITNDPDHEYEVICGARRHWTVSWLRANNYPNFKFLIDIRGISDEEAFRLSDIENRDRNDISDYERAVDYLHALKSYYKTQKTMAERLEVTEAWLSYYLELANLPDEVVSAYPDVTQIRIQHARDLKPFLKDTRHRNRVIDEARTLVKMQDAARHAGQLLLDGQQVVKRLIGAVKGKTKAARVSSQLAEYTSATGKPMMSVSRKGRAGLVITIPLNSGATKGELAKACKDVISEFYSEN